jgi:RHS repeat-associated protein
MIPQGFKDDTSGISDPDDDYAYDANGNMTTDANKKITSIAYNHLNLPIKIMFGTADKIEYLYNATGVKVQKKVIEGATTTSTEYLSGFQYKANVLQFFPHAEGYVNFESGAANYVFNYTDHLGNVRLSYTKDNITGSLKVVEENNYYAFGLRQQGYNNTVIASNYKYKFLGQERQDELGLNSDTFRHRNYDYAIGRFFGVDPVSEEYMSISTYQFAHNNPVWKIELEGLEGKETQGKDLSNHEPIKVISKPVLGFVGGGLVETKVVQKTTTEIVKEVAKETVTTGGKVIGKVLGTAFALLTDYMSPNYGGRTSEMLPPNIKIDEKLSIKDYNIKEKTIEETGIKRYEANPKHGKDKKGNASAAPQNPQEVLENSLELPGNTTRRVGVDPENKEFNVFDEHSEGKFHGHVRQWGELTQQMKNVLIDAGLVNRKGKILNN